MTYWIKRIITFWLHPVRHYNEYLFPKEKFTVDVNGPAASDEWDRVEVIGRTVSFADEVRLGEHMYVRKDKLPPSEAEQAMREALVRSLDTFKKLVGDNEGPLLQEIRAALAKAEAGQ